jgi:hypothetical protein
MPVESAIRQRIQALLQQSQHLRRVDENGQAASGEQMAACTGWIAAARHQIALASGGPDSTYSQSVNRDYRGERGYLLPDAVGEVAETLTHLVADMDAGLLSSITDQARAETFDNFLDHGEAYLRGGNTREAGVICGVVFEDTVRRVCRKHGIADKDVKLDTLISALASRQHLTDIKAKRARVAANVRTKATHAQWDEFNQGDVEATIAITRELIENQLGG